MLKIKALLAFLLVAAGMLTLSSCEKGEQDSVAPVIEQKATVKEVNPDAAVKAALDKALLSGATVERKGQPAQKGARVSDIKYTVYSASGHVHGNERKVHYLSISPDAWYEARLQSEKYLFYHNILGNVPSNGEAVFVLYIYQNGQWRPFDGSVNIAERTQGVQFGFPSSSSAVGQSLIGQNPEWRQYSDIPLVAVVVGSSNGNPVLYNLSLNHMGDIPFWRY